MNQELKQKFLSQINDSFVDWYYYDRKQEPEETGSTDDLRAMIKIGFLTKDEIVKAWSDAFDEIVIS